MTATHGLLIATVAGGVGGVIVRGTYAAMALRPGAVAEPFVYFRPGSPVNYIDAFAMLGQARYWRWMAYFLIQLSPFVVADFLILAAMDSYWGVGGDIETILALVVLLVVFYLPEMGVLVAARRNSVSKRGVMSVVLLRSAVLVLRLGLCGMVFTFSRFVNISTLAPSWDSIKGELVGALLVAAVIGLFIRMTDLRKRDKRAEIEQAEREYIKHRMLLMFGRYADVVWRVALRYDLNPLLLFSIIIYEDLNRPRLLRLVENVVVRLPRVSLTVGIAQVSSNRPLTDEESIVRMARLLTTYRLRSQFEANKNIVRNGLMVEGLRPGRLSDAALLGYILACYNGSAYENNVIGIFYLLKSFCGVYLSFKQGEWPVHYGVRFSPDDLNDFRQQSSTPAWVVS